MEGQTLVRGRQGVCYTGTLNRESESSWVKGSQSVPWIHALPRQPFVAFSYRENLLSPLRLSSVSRYWFTLTHKHVHREFRIHSQWVMTGSNKQTNQQTDIQTNKKWIRLSTSAAKKVHYAFFIISLDSAPAAANFGKVHTVDRQSGQYTTSQGLLNNISNCFLFSLSIFWQCCPLS